MGLYENSAQLAQIFMIYAAEEPERSGARRSQMAKICENKKNLPNEGEESDLCRDVACHVSTALRGINHLNPINPKNQSSDNTALRAINR